MRLITFEHDHQQRLGLLDANNTISYCRETENRGRTGLLDILKAGPDALLALAEKSRAGARIALGSVKILMPIPDPRKILCLGANFSAHADEAQLERSQHPPVFLRLASSLVSPGEALVKPRLSDAFDYEGELAVIIGHGGRHIAKENALAHVAGYSIFQDGSVRDYQLQAPQWTLGKNFQATGSFGPAFVSADELPPGAKGLKLETRLNGKTVQSASLSEMIIDVASAISLLSGIMQLEPGDVIAMGTPSGVGVFQNPPLYMKHGDLCEIEIEGLGMLRNPVVAETW